MTSELKVQEASQTQTNNSDNGQKHVRQRTTGRNVLDFTQLLSSIGFAFPVVVYIAVFFIFYLSRMSATQLSVSSVMSQKRRPEDGKPKSEASPEDKRRRVPAFSKYETLISLVFLYLLAFCYFVSHRGLGIWNISYVLDMKWEGTLIR